MAQLYVKKFDMINPFVVAASPATQGAINVLKTAKMRPGAITMRNFGHGAGGGSFVGGGEKAIYGGGQVYHSHAAGTSLPDIVDSLEKYCEEVKLAKSKLDSDIKLWVSVGHYSDIVAGGDWQNEWVRQAKELELAGADALELHFNTPGVATMGGRLFDYYHLVTHCTHMIKSVVKIPVMVKLAVENCDALVSITNATIARADAVGPTARWKAFTFDLDFKRSQPNPGGGYGGTQATPIVCNTVAEARSKGITTPMYAGGGVFNYENAARILMSGSEMVQFGALACSAGPMACKRVIDQLDKWMDENGYATIDELTGAALELYNMPKAKAQFRIKAVANEYKAAQIDMSKCIGCGRCADVCWNYALDMDGRTPVKTDKCIGCGYCFQVCPTGALACDIGGTLKKAYDEYEG
ncbi:MAG: 4Fe-4S binding protein [Clostridia bacterium]|nr:4Fe-4S binding protein [Clostridia bacterium]